MNQAQQITIEKIIEFAANNNDIIAILLCGSIADGTETDNSDVDIIVIITDDSFQKRILKKEYFWGSDFDRNEFPVEIDGKILPESFLHDVWKNGSENIQSTVSNAKLLYSKNNILDFLVPERIMSDNYKTEQIRKFYSMMKSSRFSFNKSGGNIFYLHKLIHDTIYYACRLVLTYNNLYFPCVKNVFKEISKCKAVPDNFEDRIKKLLSTYSESDLDDFYQSVDVFIQDYHFDNKIRKGYVIENELFWFFNVKPYYEI